ncbi:MAG: ATP-dependent zinc metalloprotease FtsH [Patescibacteria group bacterium]
MPIPKIPIKKPRGNSLIYIVIATLIISTIYLIANPQGQDEEKISINKFIEQAKTGSIESIQVKKNKLEIALVDGSKEYAYKEGNADIYDILEKGDVPKAKISELEIEIVPTEATDFWIDLMIGIVPFLLIIAFFVFMMRSAQSSNNQAMSFGRSKAKMYDNENKEKTTFEDVAGAKEAKEELIEIVDFLKNPGKYTAIGAKIPKGVLLVGAPGTGKTLLARAVAGEANVPFFTISGSEFVEMFVGVGASRVRDLFKRAKRNAPCIVFIDEIDAVGRHRGAGLGGGHDEREQTLNQILSEMDGFEKDTNVIVMSATNRPDILDPALLRPGRFDRRIVVDMPDIKDREEILAVHGRNKPLQRTVDLNRIARQTPGFSGADLENLMNEAAILAAKEGKRTVSQKDLEQSIEKVMMGPERKSRVLSKKEKEITAYHEAGHALVSHKLPNCDPVHKISIISRGMALGVTWMLPEEDKHLYAKSKFEDELCSLLGGYVTEEVVFGEMTTGASNDLERASNIARKMVTEYGMSALGPVIYGNKHEEIFLGKDFGHVRNYSEEMAKKIDEAIKVFIDKAHDRTKEIVIKNKPLIKAIAEDLLKKETMTRGEFIKYFGKNAKKKRRR